MTDKQHPVTPKADINQADNLFYENVVGIISLTDDSNPVYSVYEKAKAFDHIVIATANESRRRLDEANGLVSTPPLANTDSASKPPTAPTSVNRENT